METVEVIIAPSSETSHRACDCFFEGQRISKGKNLPWKARCAIWRSVCNAATA
jgi:hypothetical protein